MKNKTTRGYITNDDLSIAINMTSVDLLKQVNSPDSIQRSSAVRILAQRNDINYLAFIDLLLQRLAIEKALYTRLEIANVLESADEKAIFKIIKYLGKIGNNQHNDLNTIITSKKKSYPLARDIIARILAKTNPKYISIFYETLKNGTPQQQKEILDSIGYMIFYNPVLASIQNLQSIINTLLNASDDIIKWKCLTVLSAFNLKENIDFLIDYTNKETNKKLLQEAQRSLNIIKKT